jgi:hypothetical protein
MAKAMLAVSPVIARFRITNCLSGMAELGDAEA